MADTTPGGHPPDGRLEVDTAALIHSIDIVRQHRRIPLRTVAAEIGIHQNQLTRLRNGDTPNADNLLAMLTWLGGDAKDYTRTRATGPIPVQAPAA